jgi:hypothetical protein
LIAMAERLAFTGLLNFSTDYRTTALFWEMHVGGSAFDGYLALVTPFAVHAFLSNRTPLRFLAAGVLLGVVSYVCLTTFSRGVYMATIGGTLITLLVHTLVQRQRNRFVGGNAAVSPATLPPWSLAIGFVVAGAWMFSSSGYRGLLALWCALGVALLAAVLMSQLRAVQRMAAVGIALGIVALGGIMTVAVPKGAYLFFAALGLATASLVAFLFAVQRHHRPALKVLAVSGALALIAGIVLVAWHWGGPHGALRAALPAAALAALLMCAPYVNRLHHHLPWRRYFGVLFVTAISVAIIGVFAGGRYMQDRFEGGSKDLSSRVSHWQNALALLDGSKDLLLGKGLGRFPANYFFSLPPSAYTGSHRYIPDAEGGHVLLVGVRHANSWGEIYRLSQRLTVEPPDNPRVSFDVRSEAAVILHLEICEKHLIYSDFCIAAKATTAATSQDWQHFSIPLEGPPWPKEAFRIPRFKSFAVAVYTQGGKVEIDNIVLSGADGRNLLPNGDFSAELSRWLFVSDLMHRPWHIDNLYVHLVVEHGILGLLVFGALSATALLPLVLWSARLGTTIAPALAGAIGGFLILGLVGSLLDVPRLSFLYFFLISVALYLPNRLPSAAQHERPRPLS